MKTIRYKYISQDRWIPTTTIVVFSGNVIMFYMPLLKSEIALDENWRASMASSAGRTAALAILILCSALKGMGESFSMLCLCLQNAPFKIRVRWGLRAGGRGSLAKPFEGLPLFPFMSLILHQPLISTHGLMNGD